MHRTCVIGDYHTLVTMALLLDDCCTKLSVSLLHFSIPRVAPGRVRLLVHDLPPVVRGD